MFNGPGVAFNWVAPNVVKQRPKQPKGCPSLFIILCMNTPIGNSSCALRLRFAALKRHLPRNLHHNFLGLCTKSSSPSSSTLSSSSCSSCSQISLRFTPNFVVTSPSGAFHIVDISDYALIILLINPSVCLPSLLSFLSSPFPFATLRLLLNHDPSHRSWLSQFLSLLDKLS